MGPSITLLFPLLLTALFAHSDGFTGEAPSEPAPTATLVSPPPPPVPEVTFASPPAPALTMASPPPPPPAPEVTFTNPPAPALTIASPPPPPPAPAVTMESPPPPPLAPAGAMAIQPPAWTPVTDVNDETVKQVGKFAVRIYTLIMRLDVVFVRVVHGQTQPFADGYKYQLVIAVGGTGAKAAQYDALVWGISGTENWQLWSFTAK